MFACTSNKISETSGVISTRVMEKRHRLIHRNREESCWRYLRVDCNDLCVKEMFFILVDMIFSQYSGEFRQKDPGCNYTIFKYMETKRVSVPLELKVILSKNVKSCAALYLISYLNNMWIWHLYNWRNIFLLLYFF